MTRLLRLGLVLLLVSAVACGEDEPTITARSLGKIMPSSADAPAATTLVVEQSGPKTLEEFVEDTDVREKLGELGFTVGYIATFQSRNLPADLSTAPLGTELYGAFAVVLRDAKAATAGLEFYRVRARARAENPTTVLTNDLGKDAFAFRFSSLEDTPLPGVVYFWRVGNALFSVVGAGNPGPDAGAVRRLAARIYTRATAPA